MKGLKGINKSIKAKAILILICSMALIISSCGVFSEKPDKTPSAQEQDDTSIPISPDIEQYDIDIALYFLSDDGKSLVPEVRTIKKDSERLEELVVSELIKGPVQRGHVAVIPPNIKVLSVTSSNNIAFVDLSKEFLSIDKTDSNKFTLMIYSIVNSLTELDGIDKVQFLIEGQKVPILSSDADNKNDQSGPIARENALIQSPVTVVNNFFKALSASDLDKAYAYMSDDADDSDRKSLQEFKDYIKQMDLKIVDYQVYDYSLNPDGKHALVSLDFEAKLSNGDVIKKDKTLLKVIRLNGIWKLEWKLPLEDLQVEALSASQR
mgnify:CR=1 FL=1